MGYSFNFDNDRQFFRTAEELKEFEKQMCDMRQKFLDGIGCTYYIINDGTALVVDMSEIEDDEDVARFKLLTKQIDRLREVLFKKLGIQNRS